MGTQMDSSILSESLTGIPWKAIAQQFQEWWNESHAPGALDTKRIASKCIAIKKPPNPHSRSMYYNYEGFSVVQMALVDADYQFIWITSGDMVTSPLHSCTVNQIWRSTSKRSPSIQFPDDPLPNDSETCPPSSWWDDAFPLWTYLMKPRSRWSLR